MVSSLSSKIILISSLPENSLIGIDLSSWRQVKKNYPWCFHVNESHVHLLHYSIAGKNGEQSPKTSIFIYFDHDVDLISLAYNHHDEELQRLDLNSSERQLANQALDNSLDLSNHNYLLWNKLFGEVTKEHVTKFAPNGNTIHSVDIFNDQNINLNSNYPTVPDVKMFSVFNNLPNKERTLAALDSSPLLKDYLDKQCNKDMNLLIGELQFSFISFVIGEHFVSFEHWLNLICIVLRAESVFEVPSKMLSNVIFMLDEQLNCLPEDIFTECLPADNKFLAALQTFDQNWPDKKFENLKSSFLKYMKEYSKKFGWEFE